VELAHVQWDSVIDFPGRVAAIVWTVGCNLRCPFCYNGELVLPDRTVSVPRLAPEGILEELARRTGFLDGLAITGGEPTLQADLAEFLTEVRALGLQVKLDTNGTNPQVLEGLLSRGLVDYVALDVKAPFPRYPELTGIRRDVSGQVQDSIRLLAQSGVDYELRTTAVPGISGEDLREIARSIRGAKRYVLQPFFVPPGKELIQPDWAARPHLTERELFQLAEELNRIVPCHVRA